MSKIEPFEISSTLTPLPQRVSSLKTPLEIANILLSLTLIAIVIPSLFFTVGSYVESKVVQKQAFYVVDGLMQTANVILTPDQRAQLKPYLDQYLVPPDMSEADNRVKQQNTALLKKAYTVIGIGAGVAIFIIIMLWLKAKFPVAHMIQENLLLAGAIAVTELMVLFLIGYHYRSANLNRVKQQFVEALQKYATAS